MFETSRTVARHLDEPEFLHFIDVYRSNPYYQAFFEPDASMDETRMHNEWATDADMPTSHVVGIYRKEDNQPIAIISYLDNHPGRNKPWIGLYILHGDLHQKGYGKEILEGFLAHQQKDQGWTTVMLGVLTANTPAVEFWTGRGFRFVETRHIQALHGRQEVLVMERTL